MNLGRLTWAWSLTWLLLGLLHVAVFAGPTPTPTETPSVTPTPTPTETPTLAGFVCVGDCNNNHQVTVDEILLMANIALGNAGVADCEAGDANHDGQITVDEILTAVNNALIGCPTPVPTATPVTHTVAVASNGLTFSPSDVTIQVGETVQWVWASSAHGHNVVSGSNCTADATFCSPNDSNCTQAPLLSAGATYSHTFTATGTYPYFCRAHCGLGMVGTVIVQ